MQRRSLMALAQISIFFNVAEYKRIREIKK